MNKVYLSNRNLLTLLSKLKREKLGENTFGTIIKRDTTHKVYPQTMCECRVSYGDTDEFSIRDGIAILSLSEATLTNLLVMPNQNNTTKNIVLTCSGNQLSVTSVTDDQYYTDRSPGSVHPLDGNADLNYLLGLAIKKS